MNSVLILLFFLKVWYMTFNKGISCTINALLIEKITDNSVLFLDRLTSQVLYIHYPCTVSAYEKDSE